MTAATESAGLAPTAIAIFWCDARGASANCAGNDASTTVTTSPTSFNDVLVSPVAAALQTAFVAYEFVLPIDSARGIARFWFEVRTATGAATLQDNGGAGYILDDSLMFVDELGSAAAASSGGVTFNVIVGVRTFSVYTCTTAFSFPPLAAAEHICTDLCHHGCFRQHLRQ